MATLADSLPSPYSLMVTKLDVLDTFAKIPVCIAYTYKGKKLDNFPADMTGMWTPWALVLHHDTGPSASCARLLRPSPCSATRQDAANAR